ncbi:hypothetical protein FOZ62_029147, partial [Perkinsus olseni]
VILALREIAADRSFPSKERARCEGILRILSDAETPVTVAFLGKILKRTSRVSLVFQSADVDISTGIAATTRLINELLQLGNEQSLLEDAQEEIENLQSRLSSHGINSSTTTVRSCRAAREGPTGSTKGLAVFVNEVVVELRRRFLPDNDLLKQISTFDQPVWQMKSKAAADRLGIDQEQMSQEAKLIAKHLECTNLIKDTTEPRFESDFWLSLVNDRYSYGVFNAHVILAASYLTFPLGSVSVERLFSVYTRTSSNLRRGLRGDRLGMIVRIRSRAPLFATIQEQGFPLDHCSKTTRIDELLDKAFECKRPTNLVLTVVDIKSAFRLLGVRQQETVELNVRAGG